MIRGQSVSGTKYNELREAIIGSGSPAITGILGGAVVENGLWRIFSQACPVDGGCEAWNTSQWRLEWPQMQSGLYFWGEDAFGNQLAAHAHSANGFIWSHESGELIDLELDLFTLIESVASYGLDWIDYYNDGSLRVGRELEDLIQWESHLHWTTPLIFGGAVNRNNISVVEREIHLKGHGRLWSQVGGLPPGTEVMLR